MHFYICWSRPFNNYTNTVGFINKKRSVLHHNVQQGIFLLFLMIALFIALCHFFFILFLSLYVLVVIVVFPVLFLLDMIICISLFCILFVRNNLVWFFYLFFVYVSYHSFVSSILFFCVMSPLFASPSYN